MTPQLQMDFSDGYVTLQARLQQMQRTAAGQQLTHMLAQGVANIEGHFFTYEYDAMIALWAYHRLGLPIVELHGCVDDRRDYDDDDYEPIARTNLAEPRSPNKSLRDHAIWNLNGELTTVREWMDEMSSMPGIYGSLEAYASSDDAWVIAQAEQDAIFQPDAGGLDYVEIILQELAPELLKSAHAAARSYHS